MESIQKGVPFLSKMVFKRVRGWTLGQSLPEKNFVVYPQGVRVTVV